MKRLWALLRLCIASSALAAPQGLRTYYIDPATGSDVGAGRDPNHPWGTVAFANSHIASGAGTDSGDVVLVKAGPVSTFPAPSATFNIKQNCSFLAADPGWNIDRSNPRSHPMAPTVGTPTTSYLTVAGFEMPDIWFPTGVVQDTIADCVDDGPIGGAAGDSCSVIRTNVYGHGFHFQYYGPSYVLTDRSTGHFFSDDSFPNLEDGNNAAFAIGHEQSTKTTAPLDVAFGDHYTIRNCYFHMISDYAASVDPTCFRCYGCPNLTIRNSKMVFQQMQTAAGHLESQSVQAFRDSSVHVSLLSDTLMQDPLSQGGMNFRWGHAGGSLAEPADLTVDSCYISNTISSDGGALVYLNNYWPARIRMRYNTFVSAPGNPVLASSSGGHDTCACDISHNTFVGNISPNSGTPLVSFLDMGSGSFRQGIVNDTLGFYSNILLNLSPGGQDASGATDKGENMGIKRQQDQPELFHAGFNLYWSKWSSAATPPYPDRSIFFYDTTNTARISAPGRLLSGPAGYVNWFALSYSVANQKYGDYWSVFGNPHLAASDSIFNSQRPYPDGGFYDFTPRAGSPAYGSGAPGANGVPTTAGAIGPKFAAQKINVVRPLDQGVPGDQDFVIWLPETSNQFVDSLLVSAPDSIVCPFSGCNVPSDSLFTGYRSPLHCSYTIHGTYAANLSLSGTFFSGTQTTWGMNPGDLCHTVLSWVQPGGGVHSTDLYIEIDSDDPNKPVTRIAFDFGFGHIHF